MGPTSIRKHKGYSALHQSLNTCQHHATYGRLIFLVRGHFFRFGNSHLRSQYVQNLHCSSCYELSFSYCYVPTYISLDASDTQVVTSYYIPGGNNIYVGYSESKYRLRISLAHPRDCHFAHMQWLPLSIEKPQTPFREIRIMFMFVPVR